MSDSDPPSSSPLTASPYHETSSMSERKGHDWDDHASSALPIEHRIPMEVLIKIFTYALPRTYEHIDTTKSNISRANPALATLQFSTICRLWRNSPELWDTCWLSYKRPDFNRIWLSRAGTRPLTLYGQYTTFFSGDYSLERTKAFMESILPFRARWKIVRLNTKPFHTWHDAFSSSLIGLAKARMLEYVEVGGDGGLVEVPPLSGALFSAFTADAPNLHTLKLHHAMAPTLIHSIFPNLVNLQLRDASLLSALETLQNLPRLKMFSLITDYESGGSLTNLPYVTHENIEQLYFSPMDPTRDWSFIQRVTLPALTNLHIEGLGGAAPQTLVDMLDRSKSRITKLSISCAKFSTTPPSTSPTALVFILSCPAIEYWIKDLVLTHKEINADFLQFLKYDEEDNPCLLYLEHLAFKNCEFTGCVDGLLADALDSRCRSSVYEYEDESLGWVERKVQLRSFFADPLPGALFASDIPRVVPLDPNEFIDRCSGEINWSQEGGPSHTVRFPLGESKSDIVVTHSDSNV